MLELDKMTHCRSNLRLFIFNMTGTKNFHASPGKEHSKIRKIKNGIPQGLVLDPTIFKTHLSDMTAAHSTKLLYAANWIIANQYSIIKSIETTLNQNEETCRTTSSSGQQKPQ